MKSKERELQNGVLAENLEVGHYFIRFPEPGQLNRDLLKFKCVTITPAGNNKPVVIALNLVGMEEELVTMDTHVLIIHI